jgi:DNA-binding transcriptional MerR regulator
MDKLLTIAWFAKQSGVKVTSLRYYDELGILKPQAISQSGYRLYSIKQVPLAQAINILVGLGTKATDLSVNMGADNISNICSEIDNQQRKIAAKVQELQKNYGLLTHYREEIFDDCA